MSGPPRVVTRVLWLLAILLPLAAGGVAAYFVFGRDHGTPAPAAPTPVAAASSEAPHAAVPAPAPVANAAAPADAGASDAPSSPATADAQQPAKVATIGAWTLLCPPGKTGGQACYLQQLAKSADGNSVMLAWSIRVDDKGVHALWQTPLGVTTSQGLVFDLGDGRPRQLPFSGCAKSCVVQALFAPDYLASVEAATSIAVALQFGGAAQAARLPLSSAGLAEGLGRLSGP